MLELSRSSGVYVFVQSTKICGTPVAMSLDSLRHPWETEAPGGEMTLLRSQSKLGAESGPELRTPVSRVSSHFPSRFLSPSGPSSESSPHQSLPSAVY